MTLLTSVAEMPGYPTTNAPLGGPHTRTKAVIEAQGFDQPGRHMLRGSLDASASTIYDGRIFRQSVSANCSSKH